MDTNASEGREWVGVLGAGAIAALITALAMASPAQSQSADAGPAMTEVKKSANAAPASTPSPGQSGGR